MSMRKNMAKIFSVMLAFILTLTMVDVGAFTTKAYAAEGDKAPAKVTVLYFADDENFPQAVGQTEVITSLYGTAGGNECWDYGVIAIEPEAGYTVSDIYTLQGDNKNDLAGEKKTKATVNDSRPQEVKPFLLNAVDALKDDAVVLGYIYRNDYQSKYEYKTLNIELKDSTGNVTTMQVFFESDCKQLNNYWGETANPVVINAGDTYNPRDFADLKKYFTQAELDSLTDAEANPNFKGDIELSYMGATQMDACDYEDGTYKAKKAGIIVFRITSPKTGCKYEFYVKIKGENPIADLKVSENGAFVSSDADSGTYQITPADSKVTALTSLTISAKAAEGATVDWENVKFSGYVLSAGKTTETYRDNKEVKMDVTHSLNTSTGYDEFTITSDYAIEGTLELSYTYKGAKANASIFVARNSYMWMKGNQTYYVFPYKTANLFDFIGVVEDYKQTLIDDIISGKVTVDMPGASLVFGNDGEKKTFDGSLVFYHPGSYLTIKNQDLKLIIQSGDMDVVCKTFATIGYGESIDLATIMNGYWDDNYYVRLETEHGFTYDAATHTVTAPASGEGEKWCTAYINDGMGIYMVYAYDKSKGDEQIADIIEEKLGDGESLVVDTANSEGDGAVSDTVIKALSGNKTVRLINSKAKKDDKVEWEFNGKNVDTAGWNGKEIKLDADVADTAEEVSESLENCVDEESLADADGITVDFADNGELPGTAKIRVTLTEQQYKLFKSNKNLKLYYLDEENGKVIEEKSFVDLKFDVNQNQYVAEFEVSHNSEFILTSSTLESKNKTVAELKTNKITVTSTKVTKTTAAKKQYVTLGAKAKAGKLTFKSSDSKVKVSSNGKVTIPKDYVGKVTITITAKDDAYKPATKTVTITVNPVAVTLKSVTTPKKGQLTATWSKNSKVTGYEVQYSTSKSFKATATKSTKVKSAADVKKTISKLTGGKTYYVRVRAYKTVNKTSYYSAWSNSKSVKVKKK